MSRQRLAEAIHGAAKKHVEHNHSVVTATVTKVSPLRIELMEEDDVTLEEGDGFDLTRLLDEWRDCFGLTVGDTLLLFSDAGTYMAFDVMADARTPVRLSGDGSPEGVKTAPKGSTYQRKDGGAGTSFYVKESGTGNTGWAAK